MSTDEDTELRDMLIQNLEKNGTLAKLRAQLRASVFLALEEQDKVKNKTPLLNEKAHKFVQTNDGRLCCELVVDLMKTLNLDAAESVFRPEINIKDPRTRNDIAKSLGIQLTAEDRDQPILFALLRSFRNQSGDVSSGGVKKVAEPTGKIVEPPSKLSTDAQKTPSGKIVTSKSTPDFEDEQFRSVNDEDDFFGESNDSKNNYAFPGLSTVTQRQKSSLSSTKDSVPTKSDGDKKSTTIGTSGSSLKLSGSGGSGSLLGDLPDLSKGKSSALPPLGAGGDSSKKSADTKSNLMKILSSFDDIENDSPRISTASSEGSPKHSTPVKAAKSKVSSEKTGVKPSETKQTPPLSNVNNSNAKKPADRSEDNDDEISEEIVEDLEVDDLLSSARSAHQLSF